MRLPKSIRVMQSVYKIKWCDKIGLKNIEGSCHDQKKLILIGTHLKAKGEKAVYQTLWHEILHAYIFESGFGQVMGHQTEEIFCETLSNFLTAAVGGNIKSSR